MRRRWGLCWAILFALAGATAGAEVKPHGLFTDGAVLQRGIPIPIWGTAREGEQVTVSIHDQRVTTTAQGGLWMVRLKPMKAGGPYTLTITGENTVTRQNLLVGEVYICSGQSNMEWPMTLTENAQEAIGQSTDPLLRLYSVPHTVSDTPLSDVNSQWKECGPNTVAGFTAVGYHFGRSLRQALKVPVGLIQSAWGGTPAESWTRRGVLENDTTLREMIAFYDQAKQQYPEALRNYQAAVEKHKEEAEKARAEGKEPPKAPMPPVNPVNAFYPTTLYNGMIAPLIPYAIRGAIWYQGESNAGRAYQYQTLFPAMIRNWRDDWKQGDFPFFFVQLAPFLKIETEPKESAWAELREAQRLTALNVPRTGMAVITEFGEENDIHPRKKRQVGERLALIARATVYRERVPYSGPTFDSQQIAGDKIILRFKHAKGGLVAEGGTLKGFTLAGADGKFYTANAVIAGDKVIVSAPQVPRPVGARYGWANYPLGNLFNKDGLPASPFRTDTFRLTTQK